MFLQHICLFLMLAVLPIPSYATLFQNSYVSFELPPNWTCKLDGTEWVCVSKFEKQAKEAIIILTAKEVGPTDSLQAYQSYLMTPKSIPDKTGKMTTSKVMPVQQRLIANHPWIDGMHKGSEIGSYFTRYLATVKERLAILVTFSAHSDHYTKYSSDFLQAVESLRVIAAKDILDSNANTGTSMNNNGVRGIPLVDTPIFGGSSAVPAEPKSTNLKTKLIVLALLIGAIGYYLWRRKRTK